MKKDLITPFEKLEPIRDGNDRYIQTLYDDHRSPVKTWLMKRYRLNENEALEIFQEAFTIFYYQVKKNKLDQLKCRLRTYLTGISKNLYKQKYLGVRRLNSIEDHTDLSDKDEIQIRTNEEYNKLVVNRLLNTIGEPCRSILTMYYHLKYPLEIIAEKIGYKNANVVKKRKSLCLKVIREKLLQHTIHL